MPEGGEKKMTEDEDLKEFFARMPKRKPPTLKNVLKDGQKGLRVICSGKKSV